MAKELFNLVLFFPDGSHEYEARNISALDAVTKAKGFTTCPDARLGIIKKIMITDSGDNCNFLWEDGKVIFPSNILEAP